MVESSIQFSEQEQQVILGYFKPKNILGLMKRMSNRVDRSFFSGGKISFLTGDAYRIGLMEEGKKKHVKIYVTEMDCASDMPIVSAYKPDVYASKFGFGALKETAVRAGLTTPATPNH